MISFRRGYHINRFLYTARVLQTALTVRAANPRKRRSQANPRTHPPINLLSLPKSPPSELLTLALPSKKCGREELSDDHLSRLLDNAIKSHPTTELAVLHLMRRYQFDLDNLTEMLLGTAISPYSCCPFRFRMHVLTPSLTDSKGPRCELQQGQVR